jgi:RNA-binding protein Musashi
MFQFGKITEFEMPLDKTTKVRKGFGFITFEREDTMKDLINKRRVTIGEHTVDLRKATPKPDKMAGGATGGWGQGGGMGFGGPGGDCLYLSFEKCKLK